MPRTSIYPNGVDGYSQIRIVRDRIDEIVADDNNALRSAVVQIEQTLGIRPQSTFGTVDARITAIELGAAAISAGRLKVSTNDSTFDFLNPKISDGLNIEKSELNNGGNEQLEIKTTEVIRLPDQIADPAAVVGSGLIFANDGYDAYGVATGITELFYRDDYGAGAITQITDDGYLATASSLRRIGLFAQTSVNAPNVLGKSYLYATNVAGITELIFRDSQGKTLQLSADGYLPGTFGNLIASGFATIGTTLLTGGAATFGGNVLGNGDGYFQGNLGVAGSLDIDGYANFNNSIGVKVDLTVDGGAYVSGISDLTGQIHGFSDLELDGNSVIHGTSDVDGYANFNDGVGIKLSLAVDNDLFVTGISDLTGQIHGFGNFELDGDSIIHGTSDTDGYANFNNSLGVKIDLTVDNDVNVGNDIYVIGNYDGQGNIDINGNIGCSDVNATGNINGNAISATGDMTADGYLIAREGLLLEEMSDPPFQQVGSSFLYAALNDGIQELTHLDEIGNQARLTQQGLVGLRGPGQGNIVFVGSGGYPSPSFYDGYDVGTRFNSFSDAINVIEGYGSLNPYTIVCLDNAIYNEFINVPEYISIFAPNASLTTPNGAFGVDYAVTIKSNSKVVFGQINPGSDVGGILRNNVASQTDDAIVEVGSIRLLGQSVGILNLDSGNDETLHVKCNKIVVGNNGFAIGSLISGLGYTIVDIGAIYLNGVNSYGITQLSGIINGNVGLISGVGQNQTAIYASSDFVTVNVREIDTDNGINLQGGTLTAFVNEGSGTVTTIPGSNLFVTYAGQLSPYVFNTLYGSVALLNSDGYGATMVDTTLGNVTVTLPPNEDVQAGSRYIFKKIDVAANDMIIEGYGGRQIDGAADITTNIQYTSYTIMNDGYEWMIV